MGGQGSARSCQLDEGGCEENPRSGQCVKYVALRVNEVVRVVADVVTFVYGEI